MLEKLRYKTVSKVIKVITPAFNKKLRDCFLEGHIHCNYINPVQETPRPAIKEMKKHFRRKKIVGAEIGVMEGKNSISILKVLRIEKLFLVDAWRIYEHYYYRWKHDKNYRKVLRLFKDNPNVKIIRALSHEAVKYFKDNSLDFVYIDGNHTFSYVYQDIGLWSRKIKPNGFIAGHDILNEKGVYEAVSNWCLENNIDYKIKAPDWWFIKG